MRNIQPIKRTHLWGMKNLIFTALIISLNTLQSLAQCMTGDCNTGSGSSFINIQCDNYTGAYKNNLPQGNGTMVYSNGNSYEGNWIKGEQQGDGILNYHDGRRFVGQFRNNTMNGRGVLYSADGSIVADGIFENGNYIAEHEMKNAGTSYLETFKVNRLLEHFNILEYPYVSSFSDALEQIKNAKADGYKSISSNETAETAGAKKGKVQLPGAKGCYYLTDKYMADYGEFSTLADAVKKFVEVYSQLLTYDKDFVILSDVSALESPTIKRYLFYKNNGNNYEESWMYLSIYEWKAEHKYFVELGCGFGAGVVMKVMPVKEKSNKLFAENITALLNDADNSFNTFNPDNATLSCTADKNPLYCSDMPIELPGLGALKYISLATSNVYKGVTGYADAPTKKEAEKLYENLVRDVKNSLTEDFVYTEFGAVDNNNLEIVFADLSEIHNDRAPLVRIKVAKNDDLTYRIMLSVQFDRFEIISRDVSLAW